MTSIIVFYLIAPLFIITAQYKTTHTSRSVWVFQTASFLSVGCFMFMSFRWDLIGYIFKYTFGLLFLLAVIHSFLHIKNSEHKSSPANWFSITISLAVMVFMSGMIVVASRKTPVSKQLTELHSPLKNGSYMAIQGGNSKLTNHHYKNEPQSFALDLVKLNAYGLSATSIFAKQNLADYHIYNEPVYAPCYGQVLLLENTLSDNSIGQTDELHLAGNFVMLQCDGVEIVLAHLKQSSIEVVVGQWVEPDSMLGRVGNSGNSSEPHLHLHAETQNDELKVLNGQSVPITFNNQFIRRNQLLP